MVPQGAISRIHMQRDKHSFPLPNVSGTSNDPVPYLLSHYPPQAVVNCKSLFVLDKLIININIEINIKHPHHLYLLVLLK